MEQTFNYTFNGGEVTVVRPENPNGEWLWKTEFFTAFDKAEVDLLKLGYTRVEVCESAGTFSLRGDSLVVYPINEDKPIRLDFFGDTLERIRKDGVDISSVAVVIATDVVICVEEVEFLKQELKKSYKKFGTLLVSEKAKSLYEKLVDKLETDLFDPSLQYLFPLIKNKGNFSNYFDKTY